MHHPPPLFWLLATLVITFPAQAADKFNLTVTHDLAVARPAETIAVPFSEVRRQIPDVLFDHVVVRDATGKLIPTQPTNFNPNSREAKYDDLLFQHDFKAGEKSATFTIEKTSIPVPPFAAKVFARYVPERLDDFAWENDRIAHRVYGPRLDSPEAGSDRMISSGIDVWCKRVRYPIVDRWYLKGQDAYHTDTGEGLDLYDVGPSRGCGGLGIWDGQHLYVSHNYQSWKVLANGPIRAVFELTYEAWDAGGVKVSEVKRFTVDAGHNLDRIESTFTFEGKPSLQVGIGISKHGTKGALTQDEKNAWFSYWEDFEQNGHVGTGVVLSPGGLAGFAADETNHLILANVESGKPLVYFAGAGWDRTIDFASQEDWNAYLAAQAARLKSPLHLAFPPPPSS